MNGAGIPTEQSMKIISYSIDSMQYAMRRANGKNNTAQISTRLCQKINDVMFDGVLKQLQPIATTILRGIDVNQK